MVPLPLLAPGMPVLWLIIVGRRARQSNKAPTQAPFDIWVGVHHGGNAQTASADGFAILRITRVVRRIVCCS